MRYTREELNGLLDEEISLIYTNKKNDTYKLYKLKDEKYQIRKDGDVIFENISLRNSKIEFILMSQNDIELKNALSSAFMDMFGNNFRGGL